MEHLYAIRCVGYPFFYENRYGLKPTRRLNYYHWMKANNVFHENCFFILLFRSAFEGKHCAHDFDSPVIFGESVCKFSLFSSLTVRYVLYTIPNSIYYSYNRMSYNNNFSLERYPIPINSLEVVERILFDRIRLYVALELEKCHFY